MNKQAPRQLLAEGVRLLKDGRTKEASARFVRAIDMDPTLADAL